MQAPAEQNNNLHKLKEQHTLSYMWKGFLHIYMSIYALKGCTDMPNN